MTPRNQALREAWDALRTAQSLITQYRLSPETRGSLLTSAAIQATFAAGKIKAAAATAKESTP